MKQPVKKCNHKTVSLLLCVAGIFLLICSIGAKTQAERGVLTLLTHIYFVGAIVVGTR